MKTSWLSHKNIQKILMGFGFIVIVSACWMNLQKFLKGKSDAYSLSIRVHTTLSHILICFFFTTISTSKKLFFFNARAEKGIARHIDASSVVWSLIKLANQIARFFAIVVKRAVTRHFFCSDCAWFSLDEIASCCWNSPRKWQVCYGCREKGYRSSKT